jgi:HEPN domain-containing protein
MARLQPKEVFAPSATPRPRVSPQLTSQSREHALAYWESAKALYRATQPGLRSCAAFPLVFLYRHAIELLLKGILIDLGLHWDTQCQEVVRQKHDLKSLLADVGKLARVSEELRKHVGELDDLDLNAMDDARFDVERFVLTAEDVLEELRILADALDPAVYRELLREWGILME